MVQISNVLAIVMAGSSLVSASANTKRSTQESAKADAMAAAENFQNLLTIFSNNIGSGDQIAQSEMKVALQGYVGMLQTITKLSATNAANAANSTAFVPNWEGAVIGGGLMSQVGLITGALMGVTTTWTYKGFNDGLTGILGFDPMQALAGMPMGLPLPDPPVVPATSRPTPTAAAANATVPKVATPPAAVAPKPPVVPVPAAPAAAAPKPPVVPVPAAPAAAAPKAAASPAKAMGGMAGMGGHAHGAWVNAPYAGERK